MEVVPRNVVRDAPVQTTATSASASATTPTRACFAPVPACSLTGRPKLRTFSACSARWRTAIGPATLWPTTLPHPSRTASACTHPAARPIVSRVVRVHAFPSILLVVVVRVCPCVTRVSVCAPHGGLRRPPAALSEPSIHPSHHQLCVALRRVALCRNNRHRRVAGAGRVVVRVAWVHVGR